MSSPTARKHAAGAIITVAGASLFLLVILVATFSNFSSIGISSLLSATPSRRALQESVSVTDHSHLTPGELPRYIPTKRALATSKAHLYQIATMPEKVAPILQPWSVTVSCKDCGNDVPHFYMRAYGPSVVTGSMTRCYKEGTTAFHVFTFVPPDVGMYTVEVALTFSNMPDFHAFPLPANTKEPAFEGILLPGFPLRHMLAHRRADKKEEPDHQCTSSEVAWAHPYPTDLTPVARWKVTSKGEPLSAWPAKTLKASRQLNEQDQPRSMLGLEMEYQSLHCNLPTEEQVRVALNNMVQTSKKPLRIIFIGDSILGLQEQVFRKIASGIPKIAITSLIGHVWHWPSYPEQFNKLLKLEEHRVIIFNAGLHDIQTTCSPTNAGDKIACDQRYQGHLFDLLKTIHLVPADLKIFQTSTAAWPLYGTVKSPDATPAPTFSTSPEMVRHFNEIALEIVREFKPDAFTVMDGFTMTDSRPDNRQVSRVAAQRQLHPGQEVVSALTQQWATVLVDVLKEGGNIKLAVLRKGYSKGTPGRVSW